MSRRPAFWILFAAVSIAAVVFTFQNFSTAFPLVAIDLRMGRVDALRMARSLVEKNAWPGRGFDQAAEFSADQEVQNFIELEGGGKPELRRILEEKLFAPYTWRVRHFKEADAHETLVRFTPAGEPYGFVIKLPDQEKGLTETAEDARRIAQETASGDWKIDFNIYQPVETSRELRPGGRTDHTFVYERQDARIREGRYRLRLVVAGDKLTELTHFVQIPEAFSRRYEQMRSANDAISAASNIAVFGLYIAGFCGVGLFFMIRQHWVLWRQAALWGVFIAILMGLQQLNSWPLLWMTYDTAVSASGFAFRQVMSALGIFAAFGVLLTISFIAAETLSRRAFPHHPQFWKVWSRPVSASREIFGQTITGYLLVGPFFAYEIVLYFFAQGKLGWWTPSDTLVNPDMFANYVPSLSAIAQAAQAGFWEECLFRAAPLATAALIGQKIGSRRAFIAGAMVLQAFVFGSGHAGYANQPAYARMVELILPSFAFGTLYLLFGLLPGIILHFAYDTVWIALPLFVSSGARAHFEQAMVLVAMMVPLWIVLINRLRVGRWTTIPAEARNESWTPREFVDAPHATSIGIAVPTFMRSSTLRTVPIVGLAGLALWIFATPFHTNAPPIQISRGQAELTAREAVARRGVQLDSGWRVLSHVEGQPGEINRFVWQTAGPVQYGKLLGVYVTPPSWVVRFAKFQGDVAERAEEYEVFIRGNGEDFRISHTLPEATPGKTLTETEARSLAISTLSDPGEFKEISAQAQKRPARTDWTFVFKDTRDYGLPQGEARISIEIAGDQIADKAAFVYVPEEWSRNERARQNQPVILRVVCIIATIAIIAAGAIVGAIHWSRKRPFSSRAFLVVFGVVFLLGVLNVINSWPVFASQSSTAQPLELQIGIFSATSILVGMFTAAGLALVAGLVQGEMKTRGVLPLQTRVVIGIASGFLLAGAGALARHVAPSTTPLWGNLAPASAAWPFAAAALGPVSIFLTQILILLTVLYGLHQRTRGSAIWILVGLALAGMSPIETISSWLIIGVVTGILFMVVYRLVFRHEPQILLITGATMVILGVIRDGAQRMYPSALPASIAGGVLLAVSVWVWFRGKLWRRS